MTGLLTRRKHFPVLSIEARPDNVDRGLLFKKLHSLGINRHFLQMLNHYYNNSETFVMSGKEWIGDAFKTRMVRLYKFQNLL